MDTGVEGGKVCSSLQTVNPEVAFVVETIVSRNIKHRCLCNRGRFKY